MIRVYTYICMYIYSYIDTVYTRIYSCIRLFICILIIYIHICI